MRTVGEWLESLGLGKYAEVFAENDVDWRALPHLEAADLHELGISLGHRKIILVAIADIKDAGPLSEPQARSAEVIAAPAEKHEAGPDIRLLSVVFCDMVGSTALASRFTPEDMHDLISAYQDAVAEAIKAFGGYVAKFLGDGVLAYFGWPVAQEDHAVRAVHAGFAAVAAVERLADPAGNALRARIGIASGRVVVGDLAGGGVLDKGQIAGETPNLAARLQAAAEPGQVLVAESTYRLAQNAFEFANLGPQSLKGFAGDVPAFAALSARDIESRFSAAHGGRLAQFIGRKSELGILLDRWDFAKGGQGQVVMLVGEAGIGKSRLLETLIEQVGREESELIRLQCSPYHSTSALYPVIQRLNRVAGFAADDDVTTRLQKLDQMIALYGEDATPVRSIYAELLSLELPGAAPAMEATVQQRKEATVSVLVNRPLLASRRSPVLLVVEDAHWIDPSTSELLKEVVSRIHAARVLMVVSHRPDWAADWAINQPHVSTVTVGRLGRPQMREMIESLAGPVSDRLLDRIAERTDGVPLFVEELTLSLVDVGKGVNDSADIPNSLQGLLMARLDRLPAASKEAVQIAAVIGREFDRGLLAEIGSLRGTPLDEAISHLLHAQIIMPGGTAGAFVFRHALIQDTAYQSLLSRSRRLYHQATADAILRLRPDLVRTQPELLGRHYAEGGRNDLALPFWRKAGERALERSANFEAVDHFANALSIAEQSPSDGDGRSQVLDVRLHFAEALQHAGQQVAAIANFTQVADAARQDGNVDVFVKAALGLALAYWMAAASPERSVVLLGEAMSMLGPGEDVRRCLIMTQLARVHMLLGDRFSAETCHATAIGLARKLNDQNSVFELLINRFLVPRQLASPADAAGWLKELDDLIALADTVASDDARMRAYTMNVYVGAELGRRERMDRSVHALGQFGEARQRIQDHWVALHGSAMLAILDGDLARAEALAGQGLAIGRQAHGDQVEGVYGIQMFTIRREQDRLSEIAPVMRRFLDDNPDQAVWLPGFTLVAAELGFADQARRRLRSLAETGFDTAVDAKRSTSLSYVAEVASMLGEAEIASQIYELMSAYRYMTVTTGSVTVCYGAASRYLGMLAATMGDAERADCCFQHALEMNAAMGSRLWLAHTQADYALILRQRGAPAATERAERLWEEAWTTADTLGLNRLKRRLRPNLQ